MQRLGCSPPIVGLVIPTGYTFNLDGTNIYMTMAAVFLAQATNTHLDLGQQLVLLVVAMLSSKGVAGVYRRRFHHARSETLGGAIRSDRVSGYPGRHRPIYE